MPWVLIIIIAVAILFLAMSIKIVRQSEVFLIERLGKFHKAASAGLTIIIPFVDHVRSVVSLKQQTLDIAPQKVITRDNVTITINTVVFYKIIDPKKAVYEVQNLKKGIEYLSVTSIRDLIGKMDLDSTFSSRDSLNDKLKSILDEASSPWGCSIDRVEIQDITLPPDIQDAMEKQMNAERNKRAIILEAEGKRQADITLAEGKKQATILDAEAERESSIRRAQGVRESRILEAEGNAEAIKKVADAKAQEIAQVYGAIMNAKPDDKLVAIKSLETLEKVADGKANKVFIPFDTTKSMGALGALTEVVRENKSNK